MTLDFLVGAGSIFLWLSLGFGTRSIFLAAKHSVADIPVLPLVWPIVLLMAAYSTTFAERSE